MPKGQSLWSATSRSRVAGARKTFFLQRDASEPKVVTTTMVAATASVRLTTPGDQG